MTSRGYLSIGDVLTLLRQEFPDVTISKIRFLESQGLVNPERSPSGYRKFYDGDVGRLRWVLQQQREHFLPLKVIRDRLNREGDAVLSEVGAPRPLEGSDEEHSVAPRAVATAPRPAAVVAGALNEPPVVGAAAGERNALSRRANGDEEASVIETSSGAARAGRPLAGVATVHSLERPMAATLGGRGQAKEASEAQMAGAGEPPASARGGREGPRASEVPSTHAEAEPDPAVGDYGPNPAHGDPLGEEALSPTEGRHGGPGDEADEAAEAAAEEAPPSEPPARKRAGAKASGRSRAARSREEEPGGAEDQAVTTGVSMTAEELCRATGLDPEGLEALQRFGLVEALTVAGIPHFDEEAMTIATLAVKLADFGIEPRHLRLFRNSVDREVGLIEQVVTPLLRQRNPEARQRAVEVTREISQLGEGIRGALLRLEIRRHFGA